MPVAADLYAKGPEALVVSLAASGDREAFADLVRRRQSWIRNLMRRCCDDVTLADDLSQQIFMQAWRKIRQLENPDSFGSWLKRLAINAWLQHQRRNDALAQADSHDEPPGSPSDITGIAMDLDNALAALSTDVRLCIVLSYHEHMTHAEITDLTGLPAGTVKSHIRRGAARLRQLLSAYAGAPSVEGAV